MIKPFVTAVLAVSLILVSTAVGASTAAPYWEEIATQGDTPSPLWEAGAAFVRSTSNPDVVFRYGGQSGTFPNDDTVNDFYSLDLTTFTWTELTAPDTPAPRADTMLIPGPCGNCVSIAGGRGRFRTGTDIMFPEMWRYQVNSGQWKEVEGNKLGDPFAIRRSSATVLTVPEAGKPHKKTFYAFGGVGNTLPAFPTTPGGLRNDVAVYDKSSGWSLVPTLGVEPVPRAWATGVHDPVDNALLIFGGYRLGPDQGPGTPAFELFGPTNFENDLWSLDLDTFLWTEIDPTGPLPTPRDNVPAFFDATRNGLVIFGGQAWDTLLSDLWFYSKAQNRWLEVTLAAGSPLPPPRVGGVFFVREAATAYELYLHSGVTSEGGGQLLNDLWRLTWPKE